MYFEKEFFEIVATLFQVVPDFRQSVTILYNPTNSII